MDDDAARPQTSSLSDRLGGALRGLGQAIGWPAALGAGALIAAAPTLATGTAEALRAQTQREIAAIEQREARRLAAERRAEATRAALGPLIARPTLGATLEAVARALPAEAAIVSVERREGRLMLEVAAPDPDRLRAALRREPTLATLRDAGQRQGEGGLVVRLEGGE